MQEMWAARDKNGKLYIYPMKPTRSTYSNTWMGHMKQKFEVDSENMQELGWDDEPVKVKLSLKSA